MIHTFPVVTPSRWIGRWPPLKRMPLRRNRRRCEIARAPAACRRVGRRRRRGGFGQEPLRRRGRLPPQRLPEQARRTPRAVVLPEGVLPRRWRSRPVPRRVRRRSSALTALSSREQRAHGSAAQQLLRSASVLSLSPGRRRPSLSPPLVAVTVSPLSTRQATRCAERCAVTSPPARVRGLRPGVGYVFRVRARSRGGWSEWSAPSQSATTCTEHWDREEIVEALLERSGPSLADVFRCLDQNCDGFVSKVAFCEQVEYAVTDCPLEAIASLYREIDLTGRDFISQREFCSACTFFAASQTIAPNPVASSTAPAPAFFATTFTEPPVAAPLGAGPSSGACVGESPAPSPIQGTPSRSPSPPLSPPPRRTWAPVSSAASCVSVLDGSPLQSPTLTASPTASLRAAEGAVSAVSTPFSSRRPLLRASVSELAVLAQRPSTSANLDARLSLAPSAPTLASAAPASATPTRDAPVLLASDVVAAAYPL